MALRFLIIKRPHQCELPKVPAPQATIDDLTPVLCAPEIDIFTNRPGEFIAFSDNAGGVIGPIFDRQQLPSRVRTFDRNFEAAAMRTGGLSLLNRIWGPYVAILLDPNQHAIICRDPSGALPCYFYRINGSVILASDIELIFHVTGHIPEIDWSALGSHLQAPDLRGAKTCLHGVCEVRAGFRLLVSPNGTIVERPYWEPWQHVQDRHAPQGEVTDHLRATIAGCVSGLATTATSIGLGLSGGLDSSVLAVELSTLTRPVAAFTMVARGAEGDERTYAERVATHLKLPLSTLMHDPTTADVTKCSSAHIPRPIGNIIIQSLEHAKKEWADRIGVDSFMSGIGGDNVFCFMTSATPLVDRWRREGITLGLLQTANDISGVTGCSLLDATMAAWRKARRHETRFRWHTHSQFINPDLSRTFEAIHPWLDIPAKGLPGKAAHIALLLRALCTLEGFPRTGFGPDITPLLAQPVLELCLSIPTWQWCAGGQNRSIVRAAYQERLPRSTLTRRSKGGPDSFCIEVIESQRSQLRDQLMEGLLRANGIIDVSELAKTLGDDRPLSGTTHVRLAQLAEAEAWSRILESRRQNGRAHHDPHPAIRA